MRYLKMYCMYCVLIELFQPGFLKHIAIFSPPTQLLCELLHEGQVLSVGVSAESGLGGQWLDRIRQLIKEGSVPDVIVVPVGISYDCVTKTNVQVPACKHTHTHTFASTCLIGAICHCYALKSNRTDSCFQTVKEGKVRQEILQGADQLHVGVHLQAGNQLQYFGWLI